MPNALKNNQQLKKGPLPVLEYIEAISDTAGLLNRY